MDQYEKDLEACKEMKFVSTYQKIEVPKSSFFLVSVLVLTAIFLVWFFTFEIVSYFPVKGIIYKKNNVVKIFSPENCKITAIMVTDTLVVKKGDPVIKYQKKEGDEIKTIVAPEDGFILNIERQEGDYAKKGEPIITIERVITDPAEIFCRFLIRVKYLEHVNLINKNEEVLVGVDTFPSETFGYIKGNVDSVSELPLSLRMLKNLNILSLKEIHKNRRYYSINIKLKIDEETGLLEWTKKESQSIVLNHRHFSKGWIVVSKKTPFQKSKEFFYLNMPGF